MSTNGLKGVILIIRVPSLTSGIWHVLCAVRFLCLSLLQYCMFCLLCFALLCRVLKYSSGIRISLVCNFDCHLNKTKTSKDSIDITLRPTKKRFAELKISPCASYKRQKRYIGCGAITLKSSKWHICMAQASKSTIFF
jgi:hypothetical protein